MRLCRIGPEAASKAAFYFDTYVVPVQPAVIAHSQARGVSIHLPLRDDLVPLLSDPSLRDVYAWLQNLPAMPGALPTSEVELLTPIARPGKILLLAGNYAKHVVERGGTTAEREETFPYLFMKPSTTLTHPGKPVLIPKVAPEGVDWELELGVVMGKRCKGNVTEAQALSAVAGYTIVNDVTQRLYRAVPDRKKRERDTFFDWQHGKWFDTFCPCGPCVTSRDAIPDPQNLGMRLKVNDEVKQDGSTSQMVFPVGAIIQFIASMVTLEPGDIIATGTPAGVGSAKGTYLKPGDLMKGTIDRIGTLVTPVAAEV